MKTKEELLKIYSAYLPYDLKLQHNFEKAKHRGETTLRSWIKPLEPLDLGCLFPDRTDTFYWKPILYSMDMLTKEIEHKGERFIPIEKLFDIETGLEWSKSGHIKSDKGKDEYWVRQKEEGRSFYFGYNAENNYFYKIDSENCKQSVWKQLEMFQKLFELHFNVFGLDESEYIKKESLK